jgi:hypothetical protein
VSATLDVSPTITRPNRTRVVQFIGTGTSWMANPPTFWTTGVGEITVNSTTVLSDTQVEASVTYGPLTGTLTWQDSTTGATRNQLVCTSIRAHWTPRR